MRRAEEDGTLALLNKRVDIVLKLLPGEELLKPDILDVLRIDFDRIINNNYGLVTCSKGSIPDGTFYGEVYGLRDVVWRLLDIKEVLDVTVGDRTLTVRTCDGKWQVEELSGMFERVLRCLSQLIKEFERQGLTVNMTLLRPVKVTFCGLEFHYANLA